MGDIRKAIAEDEADYHSLCEYFNEKYVGPYTEHAKLLKEMKRKEYELHRAHLKTLNDRKLGLAKLTTEERAALGLEP